jgi:hypothetical protein
VRRFLIVVAVILLIAFVTIQFVNRPERTNPPVNSANVLRAPRNIEPILRRSCYDCHSNETKWPWYSGIAPMSWTLAHDVEEGRDELNFSEWNTYSESRQRHLLEEICEAVKKGEMPLKGYTFAHPSAKLTIEDQRALCVWTDLLRRGR